MDRADAVKRKDDIIMGISRRDFLKGMGSLAAASALFANAGVNAFADEPATDEIGDVVETVDVDLLIVGAGGAGMLAAYQAGKEGIENVLVISNSPSSNYTNGGMVSGTCALETPEIKEQFPDQDFSCQDLFETMYDFSHYTVNSKLLRKCVYMLPGNIEAFREMGVTTSLGGDRIGWGFINVHLFNESGTKNQTMQDYIESTFGTEFRFNTEAFAPIMDGAKVAGVYAKNADMQTIQINAKAVILACGGFFSNKDLMMKTFGNNIIPFSTEFQTGKGIDIAEKAGAFREAQVGLGMTDIVGGNEIVGFSFTNPLMMMAFYGNLLVDHNGARFMNEFELANDSLSVGGEALVHVKKYYAIYTQSVIDDLENTSYYEHIGAPASWPTGSMLYVAPMTGINDMMTQAIEDGYVFKADTLEELAEQLNLPELVNTVAEYNEMCDNGLDTMFGKNMDLAEKIGEGPYYLMQYNPAAFNTFGGCRTNENTQALNIDFEPIEGLYIAGVENGSLYARPYYNIGGTCSGLAYSSGRLAAQSAAEYIKG